MKALTLRFSDEDAEALEAIAKAEGRSMTSLLREAVALIIEQRQGNPDFQARLRSSMQRHQRILERLREH